MLTEDVPNDENVPPSATKLPSKETVPKSHQVKKQSTVLSPNDARTSSYRRRSLALAPSSSNTRPRTPRPFDNITEEQENLQVSPLGKIVWFAKQGLWQPLDAFLDKLSQEASKIQLKFDPELLLV